MDSVIATNGAVTEYFYDAVGNRDSLHNANGTATKYRYDNLNRLTNVANFGPGGSVISSYTYTLNAAGIRTGVSEVDGSQVTYGYDDLYRLTGETRTGPHTYAISYTYDNVGNRLTQARDGQTTTYTYNNRDQLTDEAGPNGSIVYTYDAAGRQTSKTDASGTTTYAWTDNDRMVSVSGPSVSSIYTYDAEGRRISETSAGATKNYLIDAQLPYGQVIAETDAGGNPVASYVYGQDRISMTRGSATHYHLADGQGSVRQLIDAGGNTTDSWTYSAFGEVVGRAGTTPNTFTYTGEQWDPDAGFYYLRARWYDPQNGKFASTDPWEGDPQSPVSLHKYMYGNASPVSFMDPFGNFSLIELGAIVTITAIIAIDVHVIGKRLWQAGDVIWKFHSERIGQYVEFGEIRDVVNSALGISTFKQFIMGKVGQNVNRKKRYILSDNKGWIDLQHVVSSMAAPLFGQGFTLGLFLEQAQALSKYQYSAFQPEDILSNFIGTVASGWFGSDPGYDVVEAISLIGSPLLSKSEAETKLRKECGR